MGRFNPGDAICGVADVSPPDPGPEQTDEALGSFPAIQRTQVTLHVEGSVVLNVFGDDVVGGNAGANGHLEAWDGTAWQTIFSNTISVGRNTSDSSNDTGPWNPLIAITDLSDVKVRARGDCTSGAGASDSDFSAQITDWWAFLRRRTQAAIV